MCGVGAMGLLHVQFNNNLTRGQHFSYSLPEVAEFYCA